MLVVKDRLYVSNSGGLIPSLDSTLSVIDCKSLVELDKIIVGKNPGKIVAQNDSTLYIHVRGNFTTIPSSLKKIHLGSTLAQVIVANNISGIEKMEEQLLLFSSEAISLLDMQSNSILNASFISLTNIKTVYRMQFVASLKQIFVFDANYYTNTGFIHRFSNTGEFIQKFHVGLNPNSLIYYE
jgi:hypothetical protein